MRVLPWLPRTPRLAQPALRRVGLVVAWGILLMPYATRAAMEPPRGRALLIANETYSNTENGWWDLDGPRNDVELLREVLVNRLGFDPARIEILVDATRAQMVEAFERLIAATEPTDMVYVHYSGHGSRVPDANGDEGERSWDSTLVPVDARAEGSWEILDDEIALWTYRLRQRTPDVLLVVDACHSGTISRAPTPIKVRQAPSRDDRSYAWSAELREPLQRLAVWRPPEDRFVRISACLDVETAKEYRADDGTIYGLLTWQWARALTEARPEDTYATLMRRVSARVFHLWQDLQHPRLEGARDVVAFVGAGGEHASLLATTGAEGDRVELDGGILRGVTPGSVYRGWPAQDVATVVRIQTVQATTSTARLLEGPVPEPGDLFEERARVPAFHPLALAVRADSGSSAVVAPFLAGIDGSPRLRLVTLEEGPDAVVALDAERGSISATILGPTGARYGGRTLRDDVTTMDLPGGDTRPLLLTLSRIVTVRDVLALAREHRSALPNVSVELVQLERVPSDHDMAVFTDVATGSRYAPTDSRVALGGDRVVHAARQGDVLSFRLENASAQVLYFYLLNLDPDGLVQQAFPPRGWEDWARVEPGGSKLMESAIELVTPGLLDIYVWMIVPEPTDLGFLESGAVSATRGAGEGRLARIFLQGMGSGTRGSTPVTLRADDLATRVIYVDVRASVDGEGARHGNP